MNQLRNGLVLILMLILGACSSPGPHKPIPRGKDVSKQSIDDGDGPPEIDLDVTHIPNAVPKLEPLSRYGNPQKYRVFGENYHTMGHSNGYAAEGTASWYGRKFHGQRTSSGEPYDMYGMTAAHRSLPLPTYAKVQNLHNGKEVIVKINDRGPFVKDRLIDLSYAAAKKLGIHAAGTGKVRITAIDPIAWHKQQKKDVQLAKANTKKGKKSTTQKPTQLASAKTTQATKPKAAMTAPTAKTTQVAKANKQIYIQLATFSKKTNAQKLAQSATTLTAALNNVDVHVLPSKLENKESYKVRVGPLKDEKEAQSLHKKLVALNGAGNAKLIYE